MSLNWFCSAQKEGQWLCADALNEEFKLARDLR